ncbi:phage tail protein [Pseudomonas tohonis]|uniref:DUF4376 domain-containing protein n=1 Tax=Pseudomonas tohonis TaxID=2725477 RepID=UPI0022F0A613|nr:phage tail protein [Pseudomonas tohonis]
MTTKTVYQTDPLGIFVSATVADESPLEPGVWLIPGGCVETPPPDPAEHQVPRWDGKRWQLITSYRGLTVYSTATGAPLTIERHGEIPMGYTLSAPQLGQVWRDGEWVDDIPAQLVARHAAITAQIDQACEAAITGGFWSSALGAPHRYSSQMDDQLNLFGAVLRAVGMLYACYDEAGVKAFREHSAQQLHQVGADFSEYKLQQLQHAHVLKQQLDTARTAGDLAALEAVSWDPLP